MARKIDYKIVASHDKEHLAQKVNELLDDGWELHGGVSCSLSESNEFKYVMFAQAVTRRVNQIKPAKAR